MPNLPVASIPPYPFAFFKIVHRKGAGGTTLPYRPVYNATDLNALITYLNTTYKTANGFLGTFSISGDAVIYTTAPSESGFPSNMFETNVFSKSFRLYVDRPASFSHYLWTWGAVIVWGDGTSNGYYDLNTQGNASPSHTYGATRSDYIDYFHDNTIAIIISMQPSVQAVTGTLSSAFSQFVIMQSQLKQIDLTSLFEPCRGNLHHIELRANTQLKLVVGLDKPWGLMDTFDVRYTGLSREEIDRVFIMMYRAALLNPALQAINMLIFTNQTVATPPSVASLPARKIMQDQWGWTLYHD